MAGDVKEGLPEQNYKVNDLLDLCLVVTWAVDSNFRLRGCGMLWGGGNLKIFGLISNFQS